MPVIAIGNGVTVKTRIVRHPLGNVYVIADVPIPIPVAIPEDNPIETLALPELHVPPEIALVNVMVEPRQIFPEPDIDGGSGLTVIIKSCGTPAQPFATGVVETVATKGASDPFSATNAGILPDPLDANPIVELLFVQLYTVVLRLPEKITGLVMPPAHRTWLDGIDTVGVGFTVMINVSDIPTQPAAVGVTMITASTEDTPVLIALNAPTFPIPLAARPTEVFVFDHVYVVPEVALVKLMTSLITPLQTTLSDTVSITGIPLTDTTIVSEVSLH